MELLTDAVSVHQLWNEEDSHHFGYDLTEVGSPTYGDGYVTLDGSSDYLKRVIAIGSGYNIGSTDWTMSLKFRYHSGDTGSNVYVAGLANLDWRITKTSVERIKFDVSKDGGGTGTAELVGPYSADTWYHVLVWFEASTQTIGIRINDTDEATTLMSADALDRPTTFSIGEASAASFTLDGDIGDVRVRKGSLWTSAEITTLYNSGNLLPYYEDDSEVVLEGDGLYDTRGHAFAKFTDSGGVTHVSGLVGNAFDFSGSSQRIDTPNHYFKWLTARSFHMVAWVRLDAVGSAQGLFGQSTSSYHCHVLSSNKVRFQAISTVSTNNRLDSTATLSVDTWTRISCGYDAVEDEIFLQINEGTKEVIDMSGEDITPLASSFHLGAITTSQYLNGKIDQFKMRVGGTFSTSELSDHYNSGSGAAEKTEIELDYNFTGSTAKRVKVEAKAAELSGTGTINATPWLLTAASLPDELIDTDETATVERAGAPTLRASLNEDGSSQIPLKIIDFTPAASGATAQIWLDADSYTGGTALPVYLWWIPSGSQNVHPFDSAYGARSVFSDHTFAFDAISDPTGSSGDVPDSAGNHDGTSAGTMASLASGPGSISSAWDFDGTNDEITFGTFDIENTLTFKVWAKKDDLTSRGTYIGKHTTAGGNEFLFLINSDNEYETYAGNFISPVAEPTTAWEYLVVTFVESGSDTVRKIYRDGALLTAANGTHTAGLIGDTSGGKDWVIGQEWDGGTKGDWFKGDMAAIRMIESVDTNIADIVATEYSNQNDAASFWDSTFAVTSPGSSGVTGTLSLTDGGETLAFTGNVPVSGTLGFTDGGEALDFTGNVPISGAMTLTDEGEALDFIGTVGSSPISGTLAITDNGESLSFTGSVPVSGTMSLVDGSEAISFAGNVPVSGMLSLTDGGETMVFTNAVSLVARDPFTVKAETRIFTVYPNC